jgi:hypothetical protein
MKMNVWLLALAALLLAVGNLLLLNTGYQSRSSCGGTGKIKPKVFGTIKKTYV